METLNGRLTNGLMAAVTLAIGCLATPLQADAPPAPATAPGNAVAAAPATPPTPPPPPADPFIKKDAAVPAKETGPVANIIYTFEVYTLSRADGAPLIQGNATDEAIHDRVRELVKEGKAHLDAVLCGAEASGEQFVVEQVDVMRYAIAFDDSPGKGTVPTDYKARNVGYRLVLKGQAVADNRGVDLSMFPEHTVFKGFTDRNMNNHNGPYVASLPVFADQRINTKPPLLLFEKINFLGTYNGAPTESFLPKSPQPNVKAADPEITLLFCKLSQEQLAPGTLADSKPNFLEEQLSIYSMEREKALQILSQKQEMDSAYQAVQALVKTNEAKLEHVSVLRTLTGLKCNADETTEFPYATGSLAMEWEEQSLGFSWEVNAAFDSHWNAPFLSINLSKCQLVSYLGNLQAEGVTAANNSQPVFGIQSLVTKINSALGEHELLGTFSPAGETEVNGQKDTGRVWVAFIQTNAQNR